MPVRLISSRRNANKRAGDAERNFFIYLILSSVIVDSFSQFGAFAREGSLLYLRDEFTSKLKRCQTSINADRHKFFLKNTIVALNVDTTLNTSFALHMVSRGLQNSISSLIEANVD